MAIDPFDVGALWNVSALLGRLGAVLDRLGALLGRLDAVLDRLGALLGRLGVDAIGNVLMWRVSWPLWWSKQFFEIATEMWIWCEWVSISIESGPDDRGIHRVNRDPDHSE